mgnify:CR=1 FL=1
MKIERLTLTEAALFLAGLESEYIADPYSPFPPLPDLKAKLHPEFKRWKARVRRGTQERTLSCYRDGDNPRGQVYYRREDLEKWARKLFPRQEALF